MKRKLIVYLLFLNLCPFTNAYCNGEYDIWLIPEKKTINLKDSLIIRFGITGFGDINMCMSKFCIYSEQETLIAEYESSEKKSEIFTVKFKLKNEGKTTDKNCNLNNDLDSNNLNKGIITKWDKTGIYNDLIIYPQSPGDKRLDFIFTYKCGNEWKVKNKEFNYHVNTWYERYEKWINFLFILGVIFTIRPNIIREMFSRIRKLFQKEKK